MCTVSMVLAYGQSNKITWTDPEVLEEFKKLVEQAKKFDEVAKQPDCEESTKIKWFEDIKIAGLCPECGGEDGFHFHFCSNE